VVIAGAILRVRGARWVRAARRVADAGPAGVPGGECVQAGSQRVMDQVGLTHLSLSVSDLAAVLAMVEGAGGSVVDATVTEQSAMIRDPDGQLIELLADSWLAVLPPRP